MNQIRDLSIDNCLPRSNCGAKFLSKRSTYNLVTNQFFNCICPKYYDSQSLPKIFKKQTGYFFKVIFDFEMIFFLFNCFCLPNVVMQTHTNVHRVVTGCSRSDLKKCKKQFRERQILVSAANFVCTVCAKKYVNHGIKSDHQTFAVQVRSDSTEKLQI